MSNLPPGDLRGSGMFSDTLTMYRECGKPRLVYDGDGVEIGEVDCEFTGEVDIYVDDWGDREWECPLCGVHHSESRYEDGPDPDVERDVLFDL